VAAPASVQTTLQTPTIAPDGKRTGLWSSLNHLNAEAPITYIPRHLRQEMASGASGSINSTPIHNDQSSGNGHGTTNGQNTPIHTPIQRTGNANHRKYRQTAQSPLVQPERRHVSFTEPVAEPLTVNEVEFPVADETLYSIDSEGDEFYSNVDLGDGDLRRLLDFKEGAGGVSVLDVTLCHEEASTSVNP
jgi:DNA repair and recombination protein RAD52